MGQVYTPVTVITNNRDRMQGIVTDDKVLKEIRVEIRNFP